MHLSQSNIQIDQSGAHNLTYYEKEVQNDKKVKSQSSKPRETLRVRTQGPLSPTTNTF
jgi:hypothetical protein